MISNGIKAVLSLKAKGRRSSITQFRAKQQPGLGFFEVFIREQGSIGLVLAMSNAGYPVVRANPDVSIHGGACSVVKQGDVVHKINQEYAEGSSFAAIVDKLRRTRPLTIEFVRPVTPELRARFYGDPAELLPTSGKLKNVSTKDEEDEPGGGWTNNGNNTESRKSKKNKNKMKKKVRR